MQTVAVAGTAAAAAVVWLLMVRKPKQANSKGGIFLRELRLKFCHKCWRDGMIWNHAEKDGCLKRKAEKGRLHTHPAAMWIIASVYEWQLLLLKCHLKWCCL